MRKLLNEKNAKPLNIPLVISLQFSNKNPPKIYGKTITYIFSGIVVEDEIKYNKKKVEVKEG